jgi:hypothetical protein
MQAIDYKQQLLEEMEGLSERDWEKLYRVLTVIRDEFLEVDDEARYYTESWIAAEREATEAYKRGGLKAYESVDEMMDDILSEDSDE